MNMMCCIGVAALAAISFGAKPVGYLARIGPAPLRFQTPCKGPEASVALPPLKMAEPDLKLREVTNEVAEVEAPAPAPTPAPMVQSAPIEPAFTPQMLLQFFNRNAGTNSEPAVFVPYQFTPPVTPVIPAPPSKATFTKQ